MRLFYWCSGTTRGAGTALRLCVYFLWCSTRQAPDKQGPRRPTQSHHIHQSHPFRLPRKIIPITKIIPGTEKPNAFVKRYSAFQYLGDQSTILHEVLLRTLYHMKANQRYYYHPFSTFDTWPKNRPIPLTLFRITTLS